MTQVAAGASLSVLVSAPRDRGQPREASYWSDAWRRIQADRLTMWAGAIFCVLCLVSLSAPLISHYVAGYGPMTMDLTRPNASPAPGHWFGGDEYGRDYLIRIIWAGRVSLAMGFAVALVAMTIGVSLGLMAGYYGGLLDDAISAVTNTFISLPALFVLILAATLVPPSLVSLALIIGGLGWMNVARQVRGVVLAVKERDYVQAARVLGATNGRIMLRHILPNVSSLVIVVAGFEIAAGILAESGVSFIGLGIQPPEASWGNMLTNSLRYVYSSPWLVLFPGIFIFVAVLCIYLVADGLRDALDPRNRT